MAWLLAVHGLLALVLVVGRSRVGRWAFPLAALAPLAVLVWAGSVAAGVIDGRPVTSSFEWVPALDLAIDFRVDAYSLAFLALVGVAGVAIFLYSSRYFGSGPRIATFAGTMVAFAGAMAGLVTADHLIALFLFWELTTITSYLLIGFDDRSAKARSAALHAALITGGGGLAMLGGLVLLAEQAGTYRISELLADPPAASAAVGLAWALILIGAATKSAQVPAHGWLPGAMAAPTPASAFLHSATMVKAGIFLVGRLAPAATEGAGWWTEAVVALGLATMVLGGWRALRQDDLKLLLAFGTVSQLGFFFLLAGSGDPKLVYGGIALVLAHGLFKSSLFMTVGVIDKQAGTRDLRRLSGLARSMPVLFAGAVAAAASMAAVPLTLGFDAKEAAFDGLVDEGVPLIAAAALASVLTVAYSGRFLLGAFGRHHDGHEPATAEARPKALLLWPPVVLAASGIALGVAPGLLAPLVDAAAIAVVGEAAGKLVVWPGFVPALGWSLASLVVGILLVAGRRPVAGLLDRVGEVLGRGPTAEGAFRSSVSGLITGADRTSGLIQNGSLPFYVGVIVSVAVLLPSTGFVRGLLDAEIPPLGGPLEVILAVVVVVSAVSLVLIRRRFAAVILLGGVGYGLAGLYAVLGGPDLALTQLLVETLTIALFALVLRYLPAGFDRPTARVGRVVVAIGVAAFVFIAGLVALGPRPFEPVSATYVEQALPEAGGRNVVNVILVDFRALDTLGEITVLVAAALGVIALVLPLAQRIRSR